MAQPGPVQGYGIGVLTPAALHHGDGIHGHTQEGERLQGAEDATDPQPVARCPNKIVMTGAQNTGEKRQADDDVQPLFHHLAIDARELNQQIRQEPSQDEFPDAFHPQMHHPPAPVGIHRLVRGIDHAGR